MIFRRDIWIYILNIFRVTSNDSILGLVYFFRHMNYVWLIFKKLQRYYWFSLSSMLILVIQVINQLMTLHCMLVILDSIFLNIKILARYLLWFKNFWFRKNFIINYNLNGTELSWNCRTWEGDWMNATIELQL